MLCADIDSCYKEITAYWNREISGYPFIINIDDMSVWKQIFSKLNADNRLTISAVSELCNGDNLPTFDKSIYSSSKDEYKVVIGVAQYFMLRGESALKSHISELVNYSVHGHTLVILSGCKNILRIMQANDLRLDHRIAIFDDNTNIFPRIVLIDNDFKNMFKPSCANFKELMRVLETFSYPEEKEPEITAAIGYGLSLFKESMYSVVSGGDIYDIICGKYSDVASMTEKNWGNNEQWNDLYNNLNKYMTISGVIDSVIGATSNLSSFIDSKFEDVKSREAWYLWLAMKTLGTKENNYLNIAVQKSISAEDLVYYIYMEILNHSISDTDFIRIYKERKQLIERLPENSEYINKFCDHVGQYEKNAVYYLTDRSYKEKLVFLKCLESYSYSEAELRDICKIVVPEVYLYLSDFIFTEMNTYIPSKDENMHNALLEYFHKYKFQKLTNHIVPEFYDIVKKNAVERPYNKLLPRISVIKDIDKSEAKLYFFDALGVEYLSYIAAKCDKYKLQAVIHVAHCDLPSITSVNLDFKKYFDEEKDENGNAISLGTKELDKLKHHSQTIDYRKCPEPIHLFKELEIIDTELRKIRALLAEHAAEKIILVSDHGASRLAVINQSECEKLELENKGEHSGRCCPVDEDPNIPEATYENDFAVLANYDRFKGGRKANMEVHGGATLEETLVPIIEITLQPEKSEIYLVNSFISFHNKEKVSVMIFSNVKISMPKIVVKEFGNKQYECTEVIDGKHYKFEIPDIKRSGHYNLDLYDGNKLILKEVKFETKKANSNIKEFF